MNVYFKCTVGQGGGGGGDATLTVLGSSSLAGLTCTCTNGVTTLTKTFPSTSPYDITFDISEEGTWTVSVVYQGDTYSETVQVSLNQIIDIGVFNLQKWLQAGRVEGTYATLDAVLEDEAVLRQLFLVHDAVDYLVSRFIDTNIETIFECDLAAKWINLSDYALDTFYAKSVFKTLMDTVDKYGYGEWALMSQVPKMTSNTAPYGTVTYSTQYSGGTNYLGYYAFDDAVSGNGWTPNTSDSFDNAYIGYTFLSPICIKRVRLYMQYNYSGEYPTATVKIQGSNDGFVSDIHDLSENVLIAANQVFYVDLNNDNEYSSYRMRLLSTDTGAVSRGNGYHVQFYAWQSKGNVPIMTSNTAPYGEAIYSSEITSQSQYAYMAFDNNSLTTWSANSSDYSVSYIGYHFVNPVEIKAVVYTKRQLTGYDGRCTAKIQGSNDGTNWVDLTEVLSFDQLSSSVGETLKWEITKNKGFYTYAKLQFITQLGSNVNPTTAGIQFYGRELKVSVPIMTSNTVPYGVASASGELSGYPAYNAFDVYDTNSWRSSSPTSAKTGEAWIDYKFPNKTLVKQMFVSINDGTPIAWTYTVQYSMDDGVTYNDFETESASNVVRFTKDLAMTTACTNIRLKLNSRNCRTGAGTYLHLITTLQFYGFDYSEKEFEEGTTKKWLYDHGVELEEYYTDYNRADAPVFGDNEITISIENSGSARTIILAKNISDLTSYNIMRSKCGNVLTRSSSDDHYGEIATFSSNSPTTSSSRTSKQSLLDVNMPNNHGYDISNLTTGQYPAISIFEDSRAVKFTITEWWLE